MRILSRRKAHRRSAGLVQTVGFEDHGNQEPRLAAPAQRVPFGGRCRAMVGRREAADLDPAPRKRRRETCFLLHDACTNSTPPSPCSIAPLFHGQSVCWDLLRAAYALDLDRAGRTRTRKLRGDVTLFAAAMLSAI